MRILMLNNEFPPLGGGMGTTNEALIQQLAPQPDIEIDLITSARGSRREEVQLAERVCMYKVPVRNKNIHHSSNRELIRYATQAWPLAWQLHRAQRYDFCLAWSAVPAGVVAWLLFNRLKLPYMVWVSGPDIPGFERRYHSLYIILKPIIRAVWHSARPVIAKCVEEIDLIRATDQSIHPVLIPNGVDVDKFRPSEAKSTDHPLRVVCAARLIERKGQHHLIRATKQLADASVHINVDLVGTGDSLNAFKELAKDLRVDDRVHFLGYVPRERIAQNYAEADVFVLPSFYEGMSLAALEALASGLPLLLTRTGGTRDLVEEGVNGLTFDWADVNQLAAHLHRLALNRDLAWQMGTASRQRAERFSWPAIAGMFLNAFEQILVEKHRP